MLPEHYKKLPGVKKRPGDEWAKYSGDRPQEIRNHNRPTRTLWSPMKLVRSPRKSGPWTAI